MLATFRLNIEHTFFLRFLYSLETRAKDLGVKRYSVRESSRVWRQKNLAIQLSDAGNGEAQIALLHNESYGVYRKETLGKGKNASANQS